MDFIALIQKVVFWIIGICIFFGIPYAFFRPKDIEGRKQDRQNDKVWK